MPSIYDLKPRFQALLRPVVGALAADGRVSIGVHHTGDLEWRSTHSSDGWKPRHDAELACLAVDSDEGWLVTTGADGTVRSASLADPQRSHRHSRDLARARSGRGDH